MKRPLLGAAILLTATPAFAGTNEPSIAGGFVFLWLTILSLCLYFLPAIIAFGRQHQHRVPILLVNLFLGWTLIGWVAALVWSAMPVTVTNRPPPLPVAQ